MINITYEKPMKALLISISSELTYELGGEVRNN